MPIGVTEEHEALRQSVRSWLDRHGGATAARTAVDDDTDALPSLWPDLIAQGWLALPIAERAGGAGFSLTELAVVLEELGRVCLPGPFLPSALAAVLIQDGGGPDELLARLVAGDAIATVDLTPAALTGRWHGGELRVSGTSAPVPSAGLADFVVTAIRPADDAERTEPLEADELWCVLPVAAASVRPLPSTDPTRRVSQLTWSECPVTTSNRLGGLHTGRVRAYAATVLAAEAAGLAAWCLDTAVTHAKTREQFGRPIGQFQAIKHRAADMLAAVEIARAVAWDAARAFEDGPEQADIAAALAAALAPDIAYRSARQCIQILGGMGFTWEHDAHIYLKRSLVTFQLLGGQRTGRARVAEHAVEGRQRRLTFQLPEQAERQREPARALFTSIAGHDPATQRRELADSGYLAAHLPPPWGLGADPAEQLVIDEEMRAANVERPFLQNAGFVVPTLVGSGTPEQQELIGPSLRGEIGWCQLFSEPEAGSDLASLRTKATKVPGGWSITGHKIWTTRAHVSDRAICLARTDPDQPKHRGITYFLLDMSAPGIEIRPLIEINGKHHFNQVFLTDVFAPDANVVGAINDGWRISQTTLGFERVAMGSTVVLGDLAVKLAELINTHPGLSTDAAVLNQAGYLCAMSQAAGLLRQRSVVSMLSGSGPGPAASVLKLIVNENQQQLAEFGLELLGPSAVAVAGEAADWIDSMLYSRCLTIAGGTSEIQRNVIAQRLLGLPRDP
jgi:alkylation response protein AidB-like acyl-CoA dehydrogenase